MWIGFKCESAPSSQHSFTDMMIINDFLLKWKKTAKLMLSSHSWGVYVSVSLQKYGSFGKADQAWILIREETAVTQNRYKRYFSLFWVHYVITATGSIARTNPIGRLGVE